MERPARTAPTSAQARASAMALPPGSPAADCGRARPQSGWPQVTPAWRGFLFDAAQLTRDTVVFVALAG
ncbi:MAG TPA: hypothetical protein VFV80_06935, partial [Geminicoccaceae bacterium]|nr:hypothetical protein [Geminicoccaceae bacterium]